MLKKIEITKCDDSPNVGFAFIDENGDAMEAVGNFVKYIS